MFDNSLGWTISYTENCINSVEISCNSASIVVQTVCLDWVLVSIASKFFSMEFYQSVLVLPINAYQMSIFTWCFCLKLPKKMRFILLGMLSCSCNWMLIGNWCPSIFLQLKSMESIVSQCTRFQFEPMHLLNFFFFQCRFHNLFYQNID